MTSVVQNACEFENETQAKREREREKKRKRALVENMLFYWIEYEVVALKENNQVQECLSEEMFGIELHTFWH